MRIRQPALAGLLLGVASADRCQVSTIVVHCESRCDGVNATIFSSVGATENLLPTAEAVDALAELEKDRTPRRSSGGQPLLFMQLQESSWWWGKGRTTDKPVYAPVHEMLSPDQLVELVGPLDKLDWASIKGSSLGCIDGRHASTGMYAFGGDFGEFLLALTVYEHMAQRKLAQGETTALFTAWLKRLELDGGGFAFCTNDASVSMLASAVGVGSLDLTLPPENVRPSLMLRLVAPEFTGSVGEEPLTQSHLILSPQSQPFSPNLSRQAHHHRLSSQSIPGARQMDAAEPRQLRRAPPAR
jgi:hypothetical protein